MRNNALRSLSLAAALFSTTGCLTPSMGRKADELMGGNPSKNPVAATDAPTSRMVSRNFDGTPTVPSPFDEALKETPQTREEKDRRDEVRIRN